MRRLASYWLALLLSLGGISCAGADSPPLAVHVDWGLDGPAGMIPSAVTQLTVLVYTEGSTDPQSSIHTVGNLEDMDSDGHPDLVRGDLPIGEPIRMTIQGQGAGGATIFLGHAGPFTLLAGERRYVDLRMYEVGAYTAPSAAPLTPRMLATATPLSDGRVLVAGGFSHATPMACPATVAAGSACFDLAAASDAFIFDVASGAFLPVTGGLHQARGGHTATLLPGDRVLIAGGAAHALLALEPGSAPNTWQPVFQSLDTTVQAGNSFEIFRPDDNAEAVDVDRDGDPGRGGFVGAADDPSSLGRLDTRRFMHAAAVVPGHPTQVLLAGGIDAPDSWAVYDDMRAGGYGVLDSLSNHFHASRPMPSIAPIHGAMGDALWIVGGGAATSNDDLAEVWTSTATSANGSTVAATMRMFPNGSGTAADHPELSLIGATAVPLDATHAVVVGWYGPVCDPSDTTTPVFSGTVAGETRCEFSTTTRSFTIDGMTGRAVATPTHARHAFGAGVRMSDGSALVTGGIGALALTTTNATDSFAATVPSTGIADNSTAQPILSMPRVFHAMAALDDGGALVVGGLNINTTGTAPSVGLLAAPEVIYVAR